MIFSRNSRRQSAAPKGNYVFRRRKQRMHVELRHHLDLNPETDASRRLKRRRTAGRGVKFAAALLFLMGLFSAGKIVVREAFMENPRFLLKHFSVITEGGLSAPQIVNATGLHEGMNLLGVSLVQVKETLEALPQVKRAKISRGFPGILFLEVEQRRAIAWLACPERRLEPHVAGYGCLLDENGFVIPSDELSDPLKELPVIQVANLERIVPGQKIDAPAAMLALEMIKTHETNGQAAKLELRHIDVCKPYATRATYGNGMTVTYPTHNVERSLLRLSRVMDEASRQRWQIATVDLLVEHNVPITFQSRAAKEQPSPGEPMTAAR